MYKRAFAAAMPSKAGTEDNFNSPTTPVDCDGQCDTREAAPESRAEEGQVEMQDELGREGRSVNRATKGSLNRGANSEQLQQDGDLITGDTPASSADRATCRSPYASLSRVARTVLVTLLVVLSLLTFPSSIPWMIAFWLIMHTVAAGRGKPAWVPLLVCVAILLAKRIYWPSSLAIFAGAAAVVAASRFGRRGGIASRPRLAWAETLGLWGLWITVALQWQAIATCNHAVRYDASRAVVCLGDSLTSGLLPDRGYPAQLRKLIHPPVVNFGQSGMTTEGGLQRVPRIAEVNPPAQTVIIELGGHDFLRGKTRKATKENLSQLIEQCRELGAEVILIEIPRGLITDPFWGLERELAHEKDVELIADSAIRQLVLWSPVSPPGMWMPSSHLSDDGIHTNRRGSTFLAQYVADALQSMYGPRICK